MYGTALRRRVGARGPETAATRAERLERLRVVGEALKGVQGELEALRGRLAGEAGAGDDDEE